MVLGGKRFPQFHSKLNIRRSFTNQSTLTVLPLLWVHFLSLMVEPPLFNEFSFFIPVSLLVPCACTRSLGPCLGRLQVPEEGERDPGR